MLENYPERLKNDIDSESHSYPIHTFFVLPRPPERRSLRLRAADILIISGSRHKMLRQIKIQIGVEQGGTIIVPNYWEFK